MPYIYLKKHPIKIITLDLPDQTHLGAKKPYSYLKKHPIKLITLVLPHQPRSSRAPDSTPGGKMSLETLQFSSVQSSSVQLFNKTMEQGHWGAPGSAKEPQGTPASGQLPLFCNTKHTSKRKYLKLTEKTPADERIYPITLVLPHQTQLGIENALYLLKKTPDQNNYP